jgi:GH24 family phage-related lysozyme (muramidase)
VNRRLHDLVPAQFQYWCSGTDRRNGKRKRLPGLVVRRYAEAEMYRRAR